MTSTPTGGAWPILRSPSRLYALLVLATLNAFNHLDRQLMSILLEPIRLEFGLSDIQLGFLSGPAFAVLYSVLGLPAGVWATVCGRINLIAAAAIVWGTMTAFCGFARSFGQLLVGRLGIGVGEAGITPAAQALISDLYAPGARTTAMSVFAAGLNAGVIISFLIGGFLGRAYGWGSAFIVAGIGTVCVGLLARLTVQEPVRERDARASTLSPRRAAAMIGTTLRQIKADPALRHLCLGTVLTATVGYGALAWLPSFLVRAHGIDIAKTGLFLALVLGLGGAIGTTIGGAMSDRLRRRDIRWSLWFVAFVFLATKPVSIGFYLVDRTPLALALFVLPGMAGSIFLGPSFAILHDRIEPALRPVASALLLGLVNLIGLGLGPLLVGAMSERLFASAGPHSLGYALVVMQILGVWGAVHYFWAGQRLVSAPSR